MRLHPVWLVYLLLVGTVAVFGWEMAVEGNWAGMSFDHDIRTTTLYRVGALNRPAILSGEFSRLLSVIFIHKNLLHLLVNATGLLALGWWLERYLGAWRLAAVYLLGGLGASVASFGLTLQQKDLAVGASGAVFGLGGALVGFSLRNHRILARQGWLLAGVLLLNLIGLDNVGPGVDTWAHLAGLVGGLWLGLVGTADYSEGSGAGQRAGQRFGLAALVWTGFVLLFFLNSYQNLSR